MYFLVIFIPTLLYLRPTFNSNEASRIFSAGPNDKMGLVKDLWSGQGKPKPLAQDQGHGPLSPTDTSFGVDLTAGVDFDRLTDSQKAELEKHGGWSPGFKTGDFWKAWKEETRGLIRSG